MGLPVNYILALVSNICVDTQMYKSNKNISSPVKCPKVTWHSTMYQLHTHLGWWNVDMYVKNTFLKPKLQEIMC